MHSAKVRVMSSDEPFTVKEWFHDLCERFLVYPMCCVLFFCTRDDTVETGDDLKYHARILYSQNPGTHRSENYIASKKPKDARFHRCQYRSINVCADVELEQNGDKYDVKVTAYKPFKGAIKPNLCLDMSDLVEEEEFSIDYVRRSEEKMGTDKFLNTIRNHIMDYFHQIPVWDFPDPKKPDEKRTLDMPTAVTEYTGHEAQLVENAVDKFDSLVELMISQILEVEVSMVGMVCVSSGTYPICSKFQKFVDNTLAIPEKHVLKLQHTFDGKGIDLNKTWDEQKKMWLFDDLNKEMSHAINRLQLLMYYEKHRPAEFMRQLRNVHVQVTMADGEVLEGILRNQSHVDNQTLYNLEVDGKKKIKVDLYPESGNTFKVHWDYYFHDPKSTLQNILTKDAFVTFSRVIQDNDDLSGFLEKHRPAPGTEVYCTIFYEQTSFQECAAKEEDGEEVDEAEITAEIVKSTFNLSAMGSHVNLICLATNLPDMCWDTIDEPLKSFLLGTMFDTRDDDNEEGSWLSKLPLQYIANPVLKKEQEELRKEKDEVIVDKSDVDEEEEDEEDDLDEFIDKEDDEVTQPAKRARVDVEDPVVDKVAAPPAAASSLDFDDDDIS